MIACAGFSRIQCRLKPFGKIKDGGWNGFARQGAHQVGCQPLKLVIQIGRWHILRLHPVPAFAA